MGKGLGASLLSPSAMLFPNSQVFTHPKLSKPSPFEFLWRFNYIGMIGDPRLPWGVFFNRKNEKIDILCITSYKRIYVTFSSSFLSLISHDVPF